MLERETNAEMVGFLSITPPTKAMLAEAAEAGMYEYGGVSYPRMQFLTTTDVLEANASSICRPASIRRSAPASMRWRCDSSRARQTSGHEVQKRT